MGQEVSVSYQAVKSRVYRLIDSLVEGSKSEREVQESMRRWWKLVHPTDRPMAQKYLLEVLQKSNATLEAITGEVVQFKEFSSQREHLAHKLVDISESRASHSSSVVA